jgi:uncharacterized protein
MKIVIDTNILIDSQSDDYSFANRIIDAVLKGSLSAYANRATLKENQLICLRKITDENHLKKIKVFFEAIQPAPDVKERIKAVSDPEDNKILESAVSSNADYIVTSDKHLLDLNRYGSIQILSPSSFWQRYEEKNEDPWQKWIKDFMVAE